MQQVYVNVHTSVYIGFLCTDLELGHTYVCTYCLYLGVHYMHVYVYYMYVYVEIHIHMYICIVV